MLVPVIALSAGRLLISRSGREAHQQQLGEAWSVSTLPSEYRMEPAPCYHS